MEEELVRRAGLDFVGIPAAGVHGVSLRSLPGNLLLLAKGYSASKQILREFRPDVLLFTGGYVAVPVALAAKKIPSLLYVPDIEPGMALKFLSRNASLIGLSADESSRYFLTSRPKLISGYPVRNTLARIGKDRAKRHFSFNPQQPVVLILGGSKGSRSINQAVMRNINKILVSSQIIHITGESGWDEVIHSARNLPKELRERYLVVKYMHEELAQAYSAADLVVSRAGASTLGEYPYYALPAVVVPYPYAWRYQKVNAEYLEKNKAAIVLLDEMLESDLEMTIRNLCSDQAQLAEMSRNMRKLEKPLASRELAKQLVLLAKGNGND